MTGTSELRAERPTRRFLHRSERRRHWRVPVALLGRYMLPSHQEYPCQTLNMSPGGVELIAPVRGEVGERVICYLEQIGRVEGVISRQTERGFALSLSATLRKRDKLASQLTWIANRHSLGLPEDRRHERIVPRNAAVQLRLEEGVELAGRLIDVSISGAGIAVSGHPAVGSAILVGKTPARVVREFQGGIAVEFALPIGADRFDENIIL